jgi:hypothetical protein
MTKTVGVRPAAPIVVRRPKTSTASTTTLTAIQIAAHRHDRSDDRSDASAAK